MPSYDYLIIGGGMTGDAAIHGIRGVDPQGTIGVLTMERHCPYNRPPLTKGLWKDTPLEDIWREPVSHKVNWHLGVAATALDRAAKQVTGADGETYGYRKLLLATGGTPRRLPFDSGDNDRVLYFRTVDDYQRLRSLADTGGRFVVIGSGFIGSELSAALAMNDHQVTLVFPGETIGDRLYPPDLGRFLNDYYREHGVEVMPGTRVTGLEERDGRTVLQLDNGQELEADGVAAGLGIEPNVELAQAAGLEIDAGIRVDAALRTSDPDIHAAGDVASFHNPALDRWLRVEHEDNANTMGRLAGCSMAGEAVSYDHLPFFYSDLFDLGYEALGETTPQHEVVSDWQEPFRKGVIYYLNEGRVRGVILWNVWKQLDAARQLIADPGPFTAESVKGRLPA